MSTTRCLIAALLVCGGCASKDEIRVTGTASPSEQRLQPNEIAQAFDRLADRVRNQIAQVCDSIDDTPGMTNLEKRITLSWRLRTVDATLRAKSRTNSVVGLLDLWFYTLSIEAYLTNNENAKLRSAQFPQALEVAHRLRVDAETLVARVVPEKQFPALREQMVTAAGKGELMTTSNEQQQAILGKVLDSTMLEGVFSIVLSPFDLMKGVGTGGDAMAQLVVSANRAIDLAEVYPQLLAWQMRMAVVETEEQDTARTVREELRRVGKTVEEMPTRLRSEMSALLEQTQPAQVTAQATLRELAAASAALEKAATATSGVVKDIQVLAKPAGPPDPNARPFDIREYTAALQAAEATAKEARAVLESAAAPQSKAALDAAVQRVEAAGDRLLWRATWLLGGATAAGAGLILLNHRLRRREDQKR